MQLNFEKQNAFYTKQFEEFSGTIKLLTEKINTVNNENAFLKEENNTLKERIEIIEIELDDIKQLKLENTLLVSGNFSIINNNPNEVIKFLNSNDSTLDIGPNDIANIRVLPKSSNKTAIQTAIITTNSLEIKNKIFYCKKNLRSKKIFISESLTKNKQIIFKECKRVCLLNLAKYTWTRNGQVYLKKDDNSKILHIRTLNDLKKI